MYRRFIIPAKSIAQEKFIMANSQKFGKSKEAVAKEWIAPNKGKKLPEKVKPAKDKGKKK
jgi:hypothetical protein